MKIKMIAKGVSFLLHPIVFAIIVPFLLVYKQSSNISYGVMWSFISFIFLFSASLVFLFLTKKEKSDSFENVIDISSQRNRDIFYAICILFTFLFFIYALLLKGLSFSLSITSLGLLLGIILFTITNMFMKISIHTAIVTAFTIVIGVLYGFYPFIAVAILLPLMIWARMTLRKHVAGEILAGFIVAFVTSFATIFLYQHLLYAR